MTCQQTTQNVDKPHEIKKFAEKIWLPRIRLGRVSWNIDKSVWERYIQPFFADREFISITAGELEDWQKTLEKNGLALSTRNRILCVLKSLFGLAAQEGLLHPDSSPIKDLHCARRPEKSFRSLAEDKLKAIMASLKNSADPQAFALLLMIYTGARKNEILKARWEDIDYEKNILTVRNRGGKEKFLWLCKEAMETIARLDRNTDLLFPSKRGGKPLSDIYNFWNQTRIKFEQPDLKIDDLIKSFMTYTLKYNLGNMYWQQLKVYEKNRYMNSDNI